MAVGDLGNEAGGGLDVAEVRGAAGTDAVGLGGGADGDEDEIRGGDGTTDVGGEMEVAAAGGGDDFIEAGLIDREIVRVPGGDAFVVHIGDGDLDVRAFGGDHGHGGAADITGAEAADGLYFHGVNGCWEGEEEGEGEVRRRCTLRGQVGRTGFPQFQPKETVP